MPPKDGHDVLVGQPPGHGLPHGAHRGEPSSAGEHRVFPEIAPGAHDVDLLPIPVQHHGGAGFQEIHAVRFLVDGADILVMVELHPLQPFPEVRQLPLALRVRLDPEEIPQEIVVDSQF